MKLSTETVLERGRRVLRIEAAAIEDLIGRLNHRFEEAIEVLFRCRGRVVVTGMGKSGMIARKIASTMSSTGTPAFFLHPAEGVHGDIGMLARGDVVIALSNSGETEELLKILPSIKRFDIPLITLTGKPDSTLARHSTVPLDVSVREEACSIGLVPTASTTTVLAMGDALAVALMDKRGFKEEDFAFFHPGGALGRRLLLQVEDIMHKANEIPFVNEETPMKEVIYAMTSKKVVGTAIVLNPEGKLAGVITDGDLRRALDRNEEIRHLKAAEIMNIHPKTIQKNLLATEAVRIMEEHKVTALIVLNSSRETEGMIRLHDILKAGII